MSILKTVTAERLDLALTEPFGIAGGAPTVARNVLIRATLDDGTVGLGEAAPFTAVSGETQEQTHAAVLAMKPLVVGHEADDSQRIGSMLRDKHLGAPAARCGLEMAIIDALARKAKRPLWKDFGGKGTKLVTDMTVTTGDVSVSTYPSRIGSPTP